MPRPWTDIDWHAEPPDDQQLQASHRSLSYVPLPVGGPATDRLLAELRRQYVNGAVLLLAFQVVGDDDACHWFVTRNRFDEYGFVDHFLTSPALRDAAPDLVRDREDTQAADLRESPGGAFALDGLLASTLMSGGAYERFEGSGAQAKAMAAAALDDVVGQRYEQFAAFHSFAAWSEWFHDVAWDTTVVLVDLARRQVVLFAATDTD